jgi:hypothetical protein
MSEGLKPPPGYKDLDAGRVQSLADIVKSLPVIAPPKPTGLWAYIVAYDLLAIDTDHNYIPFVLELQTSNDWWHYLNNTWIVVREELLTDFSNLLVSKLHSKDRLLVPPAIGPGGGWLTPEAWEWINARLKSTW